MMASQREKLSATGVLPSRKGSSHTLPWCHPEHQDGGLQPSLCVSPKHLAAALGMHRVIICP